MYLLSLFGFFRVERPSLGFLNFFICRISFAENSKIALNVSHIGISFERVVKDKESKLKSPKKATQKKKQIEKDQSCSGSDFDFQFDFGMPIIGSLTSNTILTFFESKKKKNLLIKRAKSTFWTKPKILF